MNQKTFTRLAPSMIELDKDEAWLLAAILRGGRFTWGSNNQQPVALVLAGLRVAGCIAYRDRLVVTGFGYRVLRHHRATAGVRAQAAMRDAAQALWARIAGWEVPRTDANLALESALAAYLEKTA